jgi:hypothetical protein
VLVLYAATLILLVMGATLTYTRLSGRLLVRQLNSQGQAVNAASAGLTETLAWFVHQRQQPVTVFDPKLDTGGVCTHVPPHAPLANETEDPAAGIIRTYEVMSTGRVFSRYEVRRTGVADVSTRRGKPQAGTIWQLESNGIVYVRNNAAQPPGSGGNTVLARRTMRVEIQRLALQLPANAAISATAGNAINIARPSRVQGGASGIGTAYPSGTSTPRGNGTITGNPAQNTTAGAFTLQGVFGVTQQELVAMADIVVDDESQLPNPLPNMSLVVVRGNATFNPQRRLTGSGILIVLGNLNFNPQSDTFYNGVIWVAGNLTVAPPSVINGAIVANGNAHVTGGSEVAEVNYDPAILDQIRQQMGNYLFSRSPWIVGTEGR